MEDLSHLTGVNLKNPILEVNHKDLPKIADKLYARPCPICKKGILFVGRNNETFILEEYDNCVLCGQRVRYLDIQEMREREGLK